MKRYILSETQTRQEYKRRYKALARAEKHGLDIDLIDGLYKAIICHGHTTETAKDIVYMLARNGAFGVDKNEKQR